MSFSSLLKVSALSPKHFSPSFQPTIKTKEVKEIKKYNTGWTILVSLKIKSDIVKGVKKYAPFGTSVS